MGTGQSHRQKNWAKYTPWNQHNWAATRRCRNPDASRRGAFYHHHERTGLDHRIATVTPNRRNSRTPIEIIYTYSHINDITIRGMKHSGAKLIIWSNKYRKTHGNLAHRSQRATGGKSPTRENHTCRKLGKYTNVETEKETGETATLLRNLLACKMFNGNSAT